MEGSGESIAKKKKKEQQGLYLQVSGERVEVGRDLRKPQLGAIHREHDAILLAVALGRAGGSSTWLHRQRLAAGTGRQENSPEEDEEEEEEKRAHPRPGRPPAAGPWHRAGTGSPAGPRAGRMQPGEGRHC